ncbi:MAG: hypothetical protein INR71_11530, partial [Terriglobus roseus]|nr:hypothetical protein [Terriglobus roseus]
MDQINEDVWSNKISYRITVPRVNFIFGTSITADFVLTPIKKGLTIGPIKLELIETTHVGYQQGERTIKNKTEQTVCRLEANMPHDAEQTVTDIHPESLCDESYHFKMTLPLERSLRKCRQTVDSDQIKIEHRLKIYVSLYNPEGHTSQLLVKNMVNLFISPRLPVGEDQSVSLSPTIEASLVEEATAIVAPPSYDEHQLDLLFSDLNPSGAVTPRVGGNSLPNSGISTPYHQSTSRAGSQEDLTSSLDAVALTHTDGTDSADSG